MKISFTEENYLKAIHALSAANEGSEVSTMQLSDKLNIKAASTTDMLKKLSEKKLILYKKYHGVVLSVKGEKLAIKIIRKHRLWEVFLMYKLGFRWDEVHEIAEQLEHIESDELIKRLDDFLGKPKFDPHGDPIPDENGQITFSRARPLKEFKKKGFYILTGVCEHSVPFLQHLSSLGLKLGDTFQVESFHPFDQSYSVKIQRHSCFLSSKVALNILVEPKK